MKHLRKILKHILTFPQVFIHKLRGINHSYNDLVNFFRYFPFGWVGKNKTVYFFFGGRLVKFFYGHLKPVSAGIFKNGEYDEVGVKDKVVADIGVGIGDTVIYFVLKGAKKVYGYELNKRYFDMAQKNIDLNNLRNKIEIEHCGIASKKIKSSDVILGALMPKEDQLNVEKANFKTLDGITRERELEGAVLKIDVDGFEYEIIESASKETLRKFSYIFMEYHFGIKGLEKKLIDCGFSVNIKKITKVKVDYHPMEYQQMDIGLIEARLLSLK